MGFDCKHNFAPLTILLGLLLCPWAWGIFFTIQHSLDGCSTASCNFGVLAREEEYTSIYSAILGSQKKPQRKILMEKKRTYLNHKGKVSPSGLKEISPEYSLERLMLKLKLQYFGHLIRRIDSLEKTLMLGKIKGRRKRG